MISLRLRNALAGTLFGAGFGYACLDIFGYFMAVRAPEWILPVLRLPWGTFLWALVTIYLPIAVLAFLASAAMSVLRRGSDGHWVPWAVAAWLVVTLAVIGVDGLRSMPGDARHVADSLALTLSVVGGFVGGARVRAKPPSQVQGDLS